MASPDTQSPARGERAYVWFVVVSGLLGLGLRAPVVRLVFPEALGTLLLWMQPSMLLGLAYLEGGQHHAMGESWEAPVHRLALGVSLTFVAMAALQYLGWMFEEFPMDLSSGEALGPEGMRLLLYGAIAGAGIVGHQRMGPENLGPLLHWVTTPLHSLTKGVGLGVAWLLGAVLSVGVRFVLNLDVVQGIIQLVAGA